MAATALARSRPAMLGACLARLTSSASGMSSLVMQAFITIRFAPSRMHGVVSAAGAGPRTRTFLGVASPPQ